MLGAPDGDSPLAGPGKPAGAHLGQLTEDTDAKGIHSVGKLQGDIHFLLGVNFNT